MQMLMRRSSSMLSIVERWPRLMLSDCHEHQAVHGRATHTSECRPAFARVKQLIAERLHAASARH
eukprot:12523492-Heterocapsa_arctica.AAC.1